MAQGDDGLTSFFFYILFVYPVTSWFLKPGRFTKRQGLTYAIAFLTVLAAIKTVRNSRRYIGRSIGRSIESSQVNAPFHQSIPTHARQGHEIYERGQNHYATLHVGRSSTPLEIKKAYKKQSLELHPDKGGTAEDFARIKDAYDVRWVCVRGRFDLILTDASMLSALLHGLDGITLIHNHPSNTLPTQTLMDPDLRETYNKFGPEGIKNNRRANDEMTMLIEIAVYYATWGMLAYVLTLGKSSSVARNWIFTGQIVMLISEVSLMLTQGDGASSGPLPDWLFPAATEHELVLVMHSLFPAYLNGCRCLGGFLYVDVDEQNRKAIEALGEQNKDILMVLRDIQVNLQSIQVRAWTGWGWIGRACVYCSGLHAREYGVFARGFGLAPAPPSSFRPWDGTCLQSVEYVRMIWGTGAGEGGGGRTAWRRGVVSTT